MSTLTQRLTAAVAVGATLTLAAPIIASAAPVTVGATKLIESSAGVQYFQYPYDMDGVLYPSLGAVQYAIALESRTDSDGKTYYRGRVRVTKINQAVRVQIDSIKVGSAFLTPDFRFEDNASVNSGTQPSVSKTSTWFDASMSQNNSPYSYVAASVVFSVRWSSGELQSNSLGGATTIAKPGPSDPADTGATDSVGSVVLNHYGDPTRGSVKVNAGTRLYRQAAVPNNGVVAVQPYATISKVNNKAVRVQIDALDLRRGNYTTFWPFNATSRSSGTAQSASLSTAITSVTPRLHDDLRRFRVHVFYSIRWDDGTLSRGEYITPVSTNSVVFPNGQGF